MRINVYDKYRHDRPLRLRKWVNNIMEAESFCRWWRDTYGEDVWFCIVR